MYFDVLNFLSPLLKFENFWANFFADFIAGAILLVAGSILLPRYLEYRKRPKLKMVFKPGLAKNKNNTYAGNLDLGVENNGEHTISHFYWHLFVPQDVNVHFLPNSKPPTVQTNGNWRHFSALEESPVYPKRTFTIGALNVNDAPTENFRMYSFFSTEFGTDPHNFNSEMAVTSLKEVESR